ncbi:MAG: hypothetical protein SGJ01_05165 [Gemmatimonadota bacterium]|nr:hypothetical protein [Gemmatimonadota bacterium]
MVAQRQARQLIGSYQPESVERHPIDQLHLGLARLESGQVRLNGASTASAVVHRDLHPDRSVLEVSHLGFAAEAETLVAGSQRVIQLLQQVSVGVVILLWSR